MLPALQVVTLVLVALGMAPAVAHALELPGKKRLPERYLSGGSDDLLPGFHEIIFAR